jgi:uncharacterized protein YsxB (DUF464 family)
MIRVKVENNNAEIKKITMTGHAMYDDYGKDIVCAAASSIATTTVNGILAINKESLSYEVSDKGLTIEVIATDNVTQTLINNMVNLLKDLEEQYPENIEVK